MKALAAVFLLAALQEKSKPVTRAEMDYGPFLSSTVSRAKSEKDEDILAHKGISIKVGKDATVLFDPELLRMAAGWTGGFLDLSLTHQVSSKGSLPTRVRGHLQFVTRRAPGWAVRDDFSDPRPGGRGPLPRERGRFKGLHRHGDAVVLAYTVADCEILEMPGFASLPPGLSFTRTFQVGPSEHPLSLSICESPATAALEGRDLERFVTLEGRTLRVAPRKDTLRFMVAVSPGENVLVPARPAFPDVKSPPPSRHAPLVTRGALGRDDGPYAVDTLALPDRNPWDAWMRLTGVDFFSDGRAAVSTWNGDVWVVSGIDDTLEKLSWKRFAAGLYEPLGVRVVDDIVYVGGRDQITRLHDLNGDGEADFYENFNNDAVTMPNYHAFGYDLQTDAEGNFYYGKGGHRVDASVAGHCGIYKVSRDGKTTEQLCTGLRAPNGLGVGPGGEITCSDQQGNWTPTSRLNWIRKGGFYGFPHHGTPDPPKSYDPPLCWVPYGMDPSSGGQVWVTSGRWGPYQGQLLHLSYGTASVIHVVVDRAADPPQGALLKMPLVFASGVMRGRFNPKDGQLYLAGLRGWQTAGARDGCLQRVRYTGKPVHTVTAWTATKGGLELTFSNPLDSEFAADAGNYGAQWWTYQWSEKYGSPEYSVANPRKQGRDTLEVTAAKLSGDGKRVTLEIPGIAPVMQFLLRLRVKAAEGSPVSLDLYGTINRAP